MAKQIPSGQELRGQLRALESKERFRLYRVARRGEMETDPKKAAIVVALARQQLKQQIIILVILVALFVGLPLLGWAQDPDAERGARLMSGIIGILFLAVPVTWFFARRYKRAERLNLEQAASRRKKGKGR